MEADGLPVFVEMRLSRSLTILRRAPARVRPALGLFAAPVLTRWVWALGGVAFALGGLSGEVLAVPARAVAAAPQAVSSAVQVPAPVYLPEAPHDLSAPPSVEVATPERTRSLVSRETTPSRPRAGVGGVADGSADAAGKGRVASRQQARTPSRRDTRAEQASLVGPGRTRKRLALPVTPQGALQRSDAHRQAHAGAAVAKRKAMAPAGVHAPSKAVTKTAGTSRGLGATQGTRAKAGRSAKAQGSVQARTRRMPERSAASRAGLRRGAAASHASLTPDRPGHKR